MHIELRAIKGDEDKTKEIFVDGQYSGTVSRGWLRNGGEQWVLMLPNNGPIGCKTLKQAKREIERNIK